MKNCVTKEVPLNLAIETSGREGSVAIGRGGQLLGEEIFSGPMRHSLELFPAVQRLLKRFEKKSDEIQQVYISAGPGSFTGIRIAVTLAKMMHLANSVKVVALDTLDVVAQNAIDFPKGKNGDISMIGTVLDAKRGQFFVAVFRREENQWAKSTPDCLMRASEFVERFAAGSQPIYLLGEGLVYYSEVFKAQGICIMENSLWTARARKVHYLGWQKATEEKFSDPMELNPFYLRRTEAEEKSDDRGSD